MLKKELAGLTFSLDEFFFKLEGVTAKLIEDDFAIAFQWWLERCKKYVCISDGCIKTS